MRRATMNFIIATLLVSSAYGALAGPIDIKGIRIGMTESELSSKYPSWDGFTIAGIPPKDNDSPASIIFHEGRLDKFTFYFHPSGFDNVLAAVKDKFPNISCSTDSVSNAMGATFPQVTCLTRDSTSYLYLSRYVGDINTSSLSLGSERSIKESDKKRVKQQKDI